MIAKMGLQAATEMGYARNEREGKLARGRES